LADRDALQSLVAEEGGNFALAPWTGAIRRKAAAAPGQFRRRLNQTYLALDNMIEAAFDTARRLFGVSFAERKDIPVWHPDVRVWR